MKASITLAALLFLVISCQKQPSDVQTPALSETIADTQSVTPAADAYVFDGASNANYGASENLLVKGTTTQGYNRITFLKFNLLQPVSTAKLRIYGSGNATISAFATSDTWDEGAITWNNQPALEDTIGAATIGSNAYSEIDISAYVDGKTTFSVALKDDGLQDKFIQLSSREGPNPPQLLVSGSGRIPEDSTIDDSTITQPPTDSNKPDHIVFIWMENKGYSQIVGSSNAPYINSLIKQGTLFTQAFGLTHPSQPNYIRFFSGASQSVSDNTCPAGSFSAKTLYNVLQDVGVSFAWYSESMPSEGYTGCSYSYYRRKHNPTPNFTNVPESVNKVFTASDWQDEANFKNLPQVVCITPNMENDMHDGSVAQADKWLKSNLGKYQAWAMTHNSILVVYYDEDEQKEGNRIPVTFVGQQVKEGQKVDAKYDHYSFARLVCSLYGASTSWTSNIENAETPTGFWK